MRGGGGSATHRSRVRARQLRTCQDNGHTQLRLPASLILGNHIATSREPRSLKSGARYIAELYCMLADCKSAPLGALSRSIPW